MGGLGDSCYLFVDMETVLLYHMFLALATGVFGTKILGVEEAQNIDTIKTAGRSACDLLRGLGPPRRYSRLAQPMLRDATRWDEQRVGPVSRDGIQRLWLDMHMRHRLVSRGSLAMHRSLPARQESDAPVAVHRVCSPIGDHPPCAYR